MWNCNTSSEVDPTRVSAVVGVLEGDGGGGVAVEEGAVGARLDEAVASETGLRHGNKIYAQYDGIDDIKNNLDSRL